MLVRPNFIRFVHFKSVYAVFATDEFQASREFSDRLQSTAALQIREPQSSPGFKPFTAKRVSESEDPWNTNNEVTFEF